MTSPSTPVLEPSYHHPHKLICWKSVFGGVLISLMSYLILTALGAGIGGLTASHLIRHEEGGMGLATGAGLWLGITAVISLFLGSYFTLRVSNFITNRIGAAHGFLVASIFFMLLLAGAGRGMRSLSPGLGSMADTLESSEVTVASDPAIQDALNQALSTGNLKSSPAEVVQGLTIRLLQGDSESAKRYYAYQTGMSRADADAKISQLKSDFDQAAKTAAEKSANHFAEAGWSLFVTFLVGLIAAMIGGREGAQANFKRPIVKAQTEPLISRI